MIRRRFRRALSLLPSRASRSAPKHGAGQRSVRGAPTDHRQGERRHLHARPSWKRAKSTSSGSASSTSTSPKNLTKNPVLIQSADRDHAGPASSTRWTNCSKVQRARELGYKVHRRLASRKSSTTSRKRTSSTTRSFKKALEQEGITLEESARAVRSASGSCRPSSRKSCAACR
jgi:hypothetical protein